MLFGVIRRSHRRGPKASTCGGTAFRYPDRGIVRHWRRVRLGCGLRCRQTRRRRRIFARRFGPAPLFVVRTAADAARVARRHQRPRRHRLGPRAGDERAVGAAAGDHRLYRLHAGAARPRHHHPAGLRGAFGADPRHAGAGRTSDRTTHHRRRHDHRGPVGVRRRVDHHHRQPRRRRRPAVRHRRPVLGDVRDPAALLARVGHARGGGRRRAVGRGVRAVARAVRRL